MTLCKEFCSSTVIAIIFQWIQKFKKSYISYVMFWLRQQHTLLTEFYMCNPCMLKWVERSDNNSWYTWFCVYRGYKRRLDKTNIQFSRNCAVVYRASLNCIQICYDSTLLQLMIEFKLSWMIDKFDWILHESL